VHSYFSPYGSPYDASVTFFSVLCDLHYRLKQKTHLADSPFRFATGIDEFTGEEAWTLAGMQEILSTLPLASLEYHNCEGDYASWARTSLGDEFLAEKMNKLQSQRGERLRKSLLKAMDATLSERR
jgi:alpha-amylase